MKYFLSVVTFLFSVIPALGQGAIVQSHEYWTNQCNVYATLPHPVARGDYLKLVVKSDSPEAWQIGTMFDNLRTPTEMNWYIPSPKNPPSGHGPGTWVFDVTNCHRNEGLYCEGLVKSGRINTTVSFNCPPTVWYQVTLTELK